MRTSIVVPLAAAWLAAGSIVAGCSSTSSMGQPTPTADLAVPAPDLAPPPPMLMPGIEFSESQSLMNAGVISDHFNFARTRDLIVRVKVRSMPRVGVEHLKFVNPFGQLVFEANVPFTTDSTMNTMPGDPATSVFQAKVAPGGYVLDYPLPIAGTVFLRNPFQIVGPWSVSAIVDGASDVPTASLQVTHTP